MREKSIHRWYVFPHSFTSDLVHALVEEWGLGPRDRILDPFLGAGTTLLAAKEKSISAVGYDLSPLAVLAAKTKVADHDVGSLRKQWAQLKRMIVADGRVQPRSSYPTLVEKALPGDLLGSFECARDVIGRVCDSLQVRDFFLLALLAILPLYSRAEATGGWLKWNEGKSTNSSTVLADLERRVEMMLVDLEQTEASQSGQWRAEIADARSLPDPTSTYTCVITSPPYPNRHDYTRVFGVELMLAFLDWNQTRDLRYQTLHSHPESRPVRPDHSDYRPPGQLIDTVARIREVANDPRIPTMIEGYFLDMYICLRELHRVCKAGARVALVVGNVQYSGEAVLVDELIAAVGEAAGLECEDIMVARYRGNSAQQMGLHGIRPSRESVVVLRRPSSA